MTVLSFIADEDGVATIDWTVLAAALTAVGVAVVSMTSQGLSDHSHDMRGELQDPHFETEWFDNVAVPPPSMQD